MAKTITRDTPATPAADPDQAERDALARTQHKRRLLAAIGQGMTLTGVRLSNPATGHAEGVVITLDQAEGAALVSQIRALVEARK